MRPTARYRAVHHRSASDDQLVLMLHDRALADQEEALRHLAAGDRGSAVAALDHARQIFVLLRRLLDPAVDHALAQELARLYAWAEAELQSAEPCRIDAVALLTRQLATAWSRRPGTTAA